MRLLINTERAMQAAAALASLAAAIASALYVVDVADSVKKRRDERKPRVTDEDWEILREMKAEAERAEALRKKLEEKYGIS